MVRDYRDHVYQKFVEFFDSRACHAAFDGTVGKTFMGGTFDCKFAWDKAIKQMSANSQKNNQPPRQNRNNFGANYRSNHHMQQNQMPQYNNQAPDYEDEGAAQVNDLLKQAQQAQQLMSMISQPENNNYTNDQSQFNDYSNQNEYQNENEIQLEDQQPQTSNLGNTSALTDLLNQLAQPLQALDQHSGDNKDSAAQETFDNDDYNNESYYHVPGSNYVQTDSQAIEGPSKNDENESGQDKIGKLLQMLADAQKNEN